MDIWLGFVCPLSPLLTMHVHWSFSLNGRSGRSVGPLSSSVCVVAGSFQKRGRKAGQVLIRIPAQLKARWEQGEAVGEIGSCFLGGISVENGPRNGRTRFAFSPSILFFVTSSGYAESHVHQPCIPLSSFPEKGKKMVGCISISVAVGQNAKSRVLTLFVDQLKRYGENFVSIH